MLTFTKEYINCTFGNSEATITYDDIKNVCKKFAVFAKK